MSIKKQPLVEKVPALEKKHLSHSLSLPKGQKKNPLWIGWGITPLFPSPPRKKKKPF